jgi:hypothetical protein
VRDPLEPGALLDHVLGAFGTAFGLRRVLVFGQGKDKANLRVTAAWGEDAELLKQELVVPLASTLAADIFSVAWHTGQTFSIADAFDEKSTSRVPRVYYEFLGSASFVLYPCGPRGAGGRLLFADTDTPLALPGADDSVYLNRFRSLVERNSAAGWVPQGRDVRPLAPKRI